MKSLLRRFNASGNSFGAIDDLGVTVVEVGAVNDSWKGVSSKLEDIFTSGDKIDGAARPVSA